MVKTNQNWIVIQQFEEKFEREGQKRECLKNIHVELRWRIGNKWRINKKVTLRVDNIIAEKIVLEPRKELNKWW